MDRLKGSSVKAGKIGRILDKRFVIFSWPWIIQSSIFLIEIQLNCNVVLSTAVQQSDSVINIYTVFCPCVCLSIQADLTPLESGVLERSDVTWERRTSSLYIRFKRTTANLVFPLTTQGLQVTAKEGRKARTFQLKFSFVKLLPMKVFRRRSHNFLLSR